MRKRVIMKRLLLAVTVVAGAIAGATQLSAASSPAPAKAFASVLIPSGPELSVTRVEEIAQTQAGQAGDVGPSMSLGKGTLEQAMRSIDPSTTFPEAGTSTETGAQIRKMLSEPVALVVMQGQFTLTNARVRKGAPPPTGSVLDLVVDSHTGAVVGRALPIRQEVPIQEGGALVSAVSRGRIAVHSVMGVISGRLLVGGGPLRRGGPAVTGGSHWRVTVSHGSRVVAKLVTNRKGAFAVHVPAGSYTVAGLLPAGTPCGIPQATKHVVVRAGKKTEVQLTCSIR
ncbi:MAG: hypothetical protein ACHQC8_00785 [Solirubrobacterales bacterium]